MKTQAQPETYYMFKEFVEVEGEFRLLTPWADPMEHEYPMDWMFASPENAYQTIIEQEWQEYAKDWILVKVEVTPMVFVENGEPRGYPFAAPGEVNPACDALQKMLDVPVEN